MYLPTSLIKPTTIQRGSPEMGFLWPVPTHVGPVLIFPWEESSNAIYLAEGSTNFNLVTLEIGAPFKGLMARDIQFVADITSLYDAKRRGHPRGALVLKGDQHFLMVSRLRDPHRELFEAPILGLPGEGKNDDPVSFSRWKIIARKNDVDYELWSQECGEPE